jgi:hypothetical protein
VKIFTVSFATMASDSQITPPAKNTRSKDAQRPRSASLPPEKPASRLPTPTSPVNSLLPEAELQQPYWTDLPPESFILPRGAPTLTANLEELVPFVMTDEEMFSFRYLDHPAITSLVPFVQHGNHFHAANPAYLAKLITRALPIIVRDPFGPISL